MELLQICRLSKRFGNLQVIDDLNFSVREHTVYGFIGKNGAGKTTTMKMILAFLPFDKGEITVCGEKVRYGSTKTNRYIGYLPDVPEFYNYMTPKEYLKLCGQICGLPADQIKSKTKELLPVVGLDGVNRRIHGFSRGMKQRLGIAQALLNEPKLLICDEPTSALDPVGRKEILDILHSIKNRTTILFSTHILSDVERICDSIGILDQGKLVLQGGLSEVKGTYRQDTLLIETTDINYTSLLIKLLGEIPSVSKITADEKTVTVSLTDKNNAGGRILKMLTDKEIPVIKYEILEPSLENVFLEAVK